MPRKRASNGSFRGANPVCKQRFFLRRPAFFDILLFPLEARGPKVLILMGIDLRENVGKLL
jgi:hypothetical protein